MSIYQKYFDISASIEGWLTSAERDALLIGSVLAYKPYAAYCEIGAFKGKSTVIIGGVLAVHNQGGLLVSVDPHEGQLTYPDNIVNGMLDGKTKRTQESTFKPWYDNIVSAGLEDFVLGVRGKSTDYNPSFQLDFLFIDGLHDLASVSTDWNYYCPRLKHGAVVCWHDYGTWQGVTKVANDLLDSNTIVKEYQGDSLIVTTYKGID